MIGEAAAAVAQVRQMVADGVVRATDDSLVPITADTVCLHGDGANAVFFAMRLRSELKKVDVELKALGA